MGFRSPFDDFCAGTLAAVPGALAKLQYLSELRQGNGLYFHWGLAKEHGAATASGTIAQIHSDVFCQILRTPLESLWQEVAELSLCNGTDVAQYLQRFLELKDALLPDQLQGGSRVHFNSVLQALSGLAGAQALKTDPASSRFRLPGR